MNLRALAVLLFFAGALWPAPPELTKGFEHFYNLEYDQALAEFQKAAEREPDNAERHNHVAQVVLYREMFRAGALESELVSGGNAFLRRKMEASEEASAEFDRRIRRAIEITQPRVDANPKDVQALYSLGVAHGLRSNYNFLVKKAWMDALRDATAARKLHSRILEIDPNNGDAKLVPGIHDYVVGSLPFTMKLLGFLAGFRGDKEDGIRAIQKVADSGNANRYDAKILLAAIYRRERKPAAAVPLLEELVNRFPRNYLFRLEQVHMYGDLGDKTKALAVLQAVEDMKKAKTSGYASLPLEKIYYYRGNLLFWYNDLDLALTNLKRVEPKVAELDLNTHVMTWMRMGQIYDMKGQRQQAVEAYKHAVEAAPQSEAGKESRGYLSSRYKRA